MRKKIQQILDELRLKGMAEVSYDKLGSVVFKKAGTSEISG